MNPISTRSSFYFPIIVWWVIDAQLFDIAQITPPFSSRKTRLDFEKSILIKTQVYPDVKLKDIDADAEIIRAFLSDGTTYYAQATAAVIWTCWS